MNCSFDIGSVPVVLGVAVVLLASARSLEMILSKRRMSRRDRLIWSIVAFVPVIGPLICRSRLLGRTHRLGYIIRLSPHSGCKDDPRVAFLTDQQKHAESKVNHIDGLRQRNMAISLAIFAALLGFISRPLDVVDRSAYAAFFGLLMLAFCLLDRDLHRFSHGWRTTGWAFRTRITRIIRRPSRPVSCRAYLYSAEGHAEFFSLIPVIYYLLIIGAFAAVLVLRE